jgi:hypothetical protein
MKKSSQPSTFNLQHKNLPLLLVKENNHQRRNEQLSNERYEECQTDEKPNIEGAHEVG